MNNVNALSFRIRNLLHYFISHVCIPLSASKLRGIYEGYLIFIVITSHLIFLKTRQTRQRVLSHHKDKQNYCCTTFQGLEITTSDAQSIIHTWQTYPFIQFMRNSQELNDDTSFVYVFMDATG